MSIIGYLFTMIDGVAIRARKCTKSVRLYIALLLLLLLLRTALLLLFLLTNLVNTDFAYRFYSMSLHFNI